MVLLEYTEITIHVIDLEKYNQLPYGPIYNLKLIKLETLKTYIKTSLANSFVHFSKSTAGILILFDKKYNGNFGFCVNY